MASIARQRISRLFEIAEAREDDSVIGTVFSIAESHNISLPARFRIRLCEDCESYLFPGKNCSVRLNSSGRNIIYRCEECGGVNRHGY